MKKTMTKLVMVTGVLLCMNLMANAQVTPSTTGANFVCTGSDFTFPTPGGSTEWEVRYSATQTTTPSTGVVLAAGNKINAADVQTGYYYLYAKSTDPGACLSDAQEIPVYKLAPITPSFTAADYCSENATTTAFTATSTTTDLLATTLTYQWYTVSAGVETLIPGAVSDTYTPTIVNTTNVDITTTYRLKTGYLIGGNKYCSTIIDHDVKTLAKPATPTITITSTAETW